ncbi:Ig-like domain-containing protein [Streptomyces sp. NPDC102365]|uniref:Ig-like domain-containing protein n=1 Tax=Streptomyces sp. NPDC102365 TaxID=3366162 RepID=UPI0037F33BEB
MLGAVPAAVLTGCGSRAGASEAASASDATIASGPTPTASAASTARLTAETAAGTFVGRFTPETGSTSGVGMPVSLTFTHTVTDRAAVEQAIGRGDLEALSDDPSDPSRPLPSPPALLHGVNSRAPARLLPLYLLTAGVPKSTLAAQQ